MRLILVMTLALCISTLAGCASPPTQQEIQGADYGASVYQSDAENVVKAYFNANLKDPESARYTFGTVQRGWGVGNAFQGRKVEGGYLLDMSVNAKNSFGGYTGAKPYRFLLRNDKIIKVWEVSPNGTLLQQF